MKPTKDDIIAELHPEYDKNASDEVRDDFWGELTVKQMYAVNAEHTRRNYNPDYDYLMCNEPGRFENDEVTNYDTLYEVDYAEWKYQREAQLSAIDDMEQALERDDLSTEKSKSLRKSIERFNKQYGKYTPRLGDWYRLIEDGTFIYAQFISANWFLFYEAENAIDELQESKIPYNFKSDDFLESLNSDDPTRIYEANGKELELDSLLTELRIYQGEKLIDRIDFLISKYSRMFSGKTFRRDKGYGEEDFDPFTDFIFFDELSLKLVSPKNFLNTFNLCQDTYGEFDRMIGEMRLVVAKDFKEIYSKNHAKFNS